MKNLFLLSIILVGLYSCKSKENLSKENFKKDSILIVKELKIDTVKIFETREIEKPTSNEINLKCDSTVFNQTYKSGKIEYRIIKEKGAVKVIFKTDTISKIIKDTYYSKLYKKDSLQKASKEVNVLKTKFIKPSFWENIFLNLWKILFWIFFILFVLGISLNDLIISIFKLNR